MKGIGAGRVLTDDGNGLVITPADVALMVQAGVEVVRVELRLGSHHQVWDTALLSTYRSALSLLTTAGLRVIGLVDAGIVSGATQAAWNANNAENAVTSLLTTTSTAPPTSPFIDQFITAVAQIALALSDLVPTWEIWNEPNAYSTRSGTVYTGSSYIYPSLYATLLSRAYQLLTALQPACTIISGGLFGHDMYGLNQASSGAAYFASLCSVLQKRGAGASAPWPFHQVGQHLYLDQGGATAVGHLTTYLDYLVSVLTTYGLAPKLIAMTEGGWETHRVTEEIQASNLALLYQACAERPQVTDVLWFLLHDNPAANLYFGLCTEATSSPPSVPKQAYTAYQAVVTGPST